MDVWQERGETVFIVEDDPAVLRSMCAFVEAHSYSTKGFRSGEEFLREHDPDEPGCLITDLRLPGINGLELQQRLMDAGSCLSVIVITGYADVVAAVESMQGGALTLLEKPYDQDSLLTTIRRAIRLNQDRRTIERRRRELESQINRLSEGEQQVLKRLMQGASNKQIAFDLSIAVRTVEHRRKNILSKLGVGSIVEAVRHLAEYERLSDISHILRANPAGIALSPGSGGAEPDQEPAGWEGSTAESAPHAPHTDTVRHGHEFPAGS